MHEPGFRSLGYGADPPRTPGWLMVSRFGEGERESELVRDWREGRAKWTASLETENLFVWVGKVRKGLSDKKVDKD